jgi:Tol biopolymer transport system component
MRTDSGARRVWAASAAILTALAAAAVDPARPVEAAFPGQNGKIVFRSSRDGDAEIYSMNADGSGLTRLTNDPGPDLHPTWSPDGSKIAFSRLLEGANFEIFVMDADGTDQTNLTDNPASDQIPAWSPDGTRLAFTSSRDSGSDIIVMDADGTDQTNLTDGPFRDISPAWSPDGTKIVFRRDNGIAVMNADGTAVTLLTSGPFQDAAPTWSPDGTKIAFASDRDGNFEIYVMNADGTDQTRLTDHPRYDLSPAWSPDGCKIVFASGRDNLGGDIHVMDADGTDVVNLTNDFLPDEDPDWQPLVAPDTAPPRITTANQPITLATPDHKYATLTVEQMVSAVSDDRDSAVGVADVVIANVSSDEPEDAPGNGDGSTARDIVIASDCRQVQLRAERAGGINGRVYTVTLQVADASGNVASAVFRVHVPVSRCETAVDDGVAAGYAVTGCAP